MPLKFRSLGSFFALIAFLLLAKPAEGQDWFRTPALGMDKNHLAVADFGPRVDPAKTHSAQFTQIVRDDLAFSGIIDLASPSFYPAGAPKPPGVETRKFGLTRRSTPLVAFGNLNETAAEVAVEAWLYDVRQPLPAIRRRQNLSGRADRQPSPQIRPSIRRRNHR